MSDLLTYRLLDAVARYGSIRRAAEKSAITPSALNRRILNLEEECGTPLFERTNAGMRPNVAGELVLTFVRKQLAELSKVKSQIADLSSLRMGSVNLAVSPALLPAYLPGKVQRYQSEFPQVDFKVHEVLSGEAEPLLMNYEVDLALVMDSQFSPDTTMVGEMNLIVQVIMDAGHLLATREQLKISDLTAYPLALPSENSNLFMHLERLMLASQIHLKPQIQCSHAAFIQQCTKGSELLSFMLTPNNEDHNLPDGLVARPLAHRKASICATLLRRGGVEARDLGGGLRAAEGAGLEPGVERVADTITEQVHPHDDDQDHGPGHEGRVRAGDQGRAGLPEHGPEIGLRGLGAEAEEGQTGGLEDHPAHGRQDCNHDGGNDVGQDFADDDAQVVAPVQPCRVDVFEVNDGDGDAPDVAREKRDVDGGNGDERVEQPRPQHRNNSQREQDVGKAHQGIDATHDDIVGPAAEISGDDAHGCADHCGDHGGGEANQQRQPRPPQQPAEQVTPEVIRAEQGTFGERQPEAAGRIDHVRVGQRQQGGDQRQHDQRHKHHQSDQCQPVARDQPDQPDHVLILESSRVCSTSTMMLNST